MKHDSAEVTLVSAKVAGEVYQVGLIARKLSLAAKNAMAMVMRSGSTDSGLRVVSDFFSELANNAIANAQLINKTAVLLAHNSVKQWQMRKFEEAMEHAVMLSVNNDKVATLHVRTLKQTEYKRCELEIVFRKQWDQLINYLTGIHQQIKASNVIAVNFRLEALSTGEQEKLLNHMATDIDQLSQEIKAHVQRSLKLLGEFRI